MFNLPKFSGQDSKKTFPAIVIKKMVIFPTEKASLVLQGEKVGDTIDRTHKGDHLLVLLFQKNGENSPVGVLAKVLEHWSLAPNVIGLIIEGLRRVEIVRDYLEDGSKLVDVTEIASEEAQNEGEAAKNEALSRRAFDQFKKILQAEGSVPLTIIDDLQQEDLPPERISDLIASSIKLEFSERLALLEKINVRERLELLNTKLTSEIQVTQAEKEIQDQVNKELEQSQKELLLREKLKAIEKELGIYEEQKEYDQLEQKINNAGLPKEAEEKIRGELHRLRQMSAGSAEVPYIRNYLEWVTDLPWSKKSEVQVDLDRAREVLNEDHFGLERPKERVLEYLAVQKLTSGKGRGTILCFVGPPGTGKTSVGQSIARAVGREFVRISLGGVRDEAEIRGHRRTYVGALPGRIIQGIRNAKSKNPVFMMDEIDKLGVDFHGDPSAALLEVLDPAQNFSFTDHYIDIPFDLSEVFFITTANILDPIPPVLQDRVEVIEFPGYTDEEKFHIAKKYLAPRVLKESGLPEGCLTFEDEAIRGIVSNYTREAGVRELERKLAEISRKIAMKVARGESDGPVLIRKEKLVDYLGPEEYELETKEEKDEVGVATGLAWTPTGGEIIFIETNLVPGKGNLTITGQLGEVMQESARAALSYVRSRSKKYHFDENFYYQADIHIHVPSGAIAKDGPSAGVAIAIALASMLTGEKIKKDVALTGEVTLSGKVLKVGGIKEKVLAAHRAGIKTIIMPKENEKNLLDVPEEVKRDLEFKFVKHMDEVASIALT